MHSNTGFLDTTEDEYDRIFDINLKGMFFLSKSFVKYFLKKGRRANILNICSTHGFRSALDPYKISKWGTVGFTEGLGKAYDSEKIIVNGIAPGGTATGMIGMDDKGDLSLPLPSGRASLPSEIANLAVFMLSDMGSNMIGTIVKYDR